MLNIQKKYLDFPLDHLVNVLNPTLLSFRHFLRLHAVVTPQRFQHPHNLQVGFKREVLATQVDEVFPFGGRVVEISHAVEVRLNS